MLNQGSYNFTVCLAESIDGLNDTLDGTLTAAERGKSAGDLSVDLIAERKPFGPLNSIPAGMPM